MSMASDKEKFLGRRILARGQDPFVNMCPEGISHLWQSITYEGVEDGAIAVRSHKNPWRLGEAPEKIIWPPRRGYPSGPCSRQLWAPEGHYNPVEENWQVAVAASDGDNANHRMFLLESENEDPSSEYHELGQIDLLKDYWVIDLTYFWWRLKDIHKYELFAVGSGSNPGEQDSRQGIHVYRMKNFQRAEEGPIELDGIDWPWKRRSDRIIEEGPQILRPDMRGSFPKIDEPLVLFTANNRSWAKDYCMGARKLTGKRDPLNPADWEEIDHPVFCGPEDDGRGHGSFLSYRGRDMLIYHRMGNGEGWDAREVWMMEYQWDKATGIPVW